MSAGMEDGKEGEVGNVCVVVAGDGLGREGKGLLMFEWKRE